jgi:aerobic-type carbon monoxide dehydrogenase small subunit (CoxS/CutS family)
VQVDGQAVFSCLLPVAAAAGRRIRTVEGLGSAEAPSPLQRAFIEEQAAQCGYCIAGMIMRAQALLDAKPKPSEAEIRAHMQPNLCRCGTHMRILRAIRRAAGLPVEAA